MEELIKKAQDVVGDASRGDDDIRIVLNLLLRQDIEIQDLKSTLRQLINKHSKKYVSFKDFCEITDLSESAAYKTLNKGVIEVFKPMGKKIYINRDDIDKFIKNGRI